MRFVYVVENLDNGLKFGMLIDYTNIHHIGIGIPVFDQSEFFIFNRFSFFKDFFGPKTQNFEKWDSRFEEKFNPSLFILTICKLFKSLFFYDFSNICRFGTQNDKS